MTERLEQRRAKNARRDSHSVNHTIRPHTPGGVFTPLLYDVLRRQRYTSYADLCGDFQQRCRRERITYDDTLFLAALAKVERGGKRPCVRPELPQRSTPAPHADPPPIRPQEARRLCAALLDRYLKEHPEACQVGPRAMRPAYFPDLVRIR
jgi:hypothetical protein